MQVRVRSDQLRKDWPLSGSKAYTQERTQHLPWTELAHIMRASIYLVLLPLTHLLCVSAAAVPGKLTLPD